MVDNQQWSIDRATRLYAISQWGDGYFFIDANGHVCVRPDLQQDTCIDLFEAVRSLQTSGVSLPVLIRFPDILRDRVRRLEQAFKHSSQLHGYLGHYTPVYPIKVNQQGSVVENIIQAENIGLEAGSKPELLAILGLSKPGEVIICNGYKDRAYIRMALMGYKMGQKVFIVIEKLSELALIIAAANDLGVTPLLGVRVRLSTISAGKWQNSGGEKSKFGLHAGEILQLIDELKSAAMLDCLQLMHFHMGSQIANIHDIKLALKEAGQFFFQLQQLGAPINTVDTGGGLGVDYDGSHSRRECSVNYSLSEYADNIVHAFAEICARHSLRHPDIMTESGRAITAHHAVLISNVTEVECFSASPEEPESKHSNILETWHNIQFEISQFREMFVQGDIELKTLAEKEQQYLCACQSIYQELDDSIHSHREIRQELDEKLADKVFCNFSLFQSLPDVWGIGQIFPIMPIHRLDEKPLRRAVIQDLTCDSDGRIDAYVEGQNIEKTLPLHRINTDENYLIGFFMVGAYQEILGDMHNLFGDTHSVNIELNKQGYVINHELEGEQVRDLLDYVHIDTEKLQQAYRRKLAQGSLTKQQQQQYLQELVQGLNAYTYLEK